METTYKEGILGARKGLVWGKCLVCLIVRLASANKMTLKLTLCFFFPSQNQKVHQQY